MAGHGASADARTILVAGTASHVGKSTVVAGLCRLLADRGVRVAPFKAQNMSNNARAVPVAPGADAGSEADADAGANVDAFGEIGVSQYVQARAARIAPTTDHNPVLLKPRGGGESQLVIDGRPAGDHAAADYYEDGWHRARDAAEAAHARLAADHDVVVAEGAGSIAEINLHHRDLANVETARFADADVLLVADIERGGVFASLVGTLELVPDDIRDRVVGAVITKFRGDESLLADGLDAFESRTGVPVLGVLPYDDPGLPEEDSVSLPAEGERGVFGGGRGVSDRAGGVTVAVPRLPRISNATDLEPLAAEPGVRVAYVPLDSDLSDADAVVLPGSKNTADDLRACRAAGLHDRLREFSGPVVGLCGGYQLLGERLSNVGTESVRGGPGGEEAGGGDEGDEGDADELPGFGLLPVETAFSTAKRVAPAAWRFEGVGPFDGFAGSVSGYEIHTGETRVVEGGESADLVTPFAAPDGRADASLGLARGRVLGTYLHGLFENEGARDAFVGGLFAAAGRTRPGRTGGEEADGDGGGDGDDSPYDRAAALVSRLDLGPLGFGEGD